MQYDLYLKKKGKFVDRHAHRENTMGKWIAVILLQA